MISIVNDLGECRRIWQALIPPQGLFDIWALRACFQRAYGYTPSFIVAGQTRSPKGLLALSWIAEHRYWGCFPGETFKGKTWLEQNRIVVDSGVTAGEILDGCPVPLHLRYLDLPSAECEPLSSLDEVGYLFRPADYEYRFDRYLESFNGKRRRAFRRDLDAFEARGVTYRYNNTRDIDRAFTLNLRAFGENSYFWDKRFLDAFLEVMAYLHGRDLLRVVTVRVGGKIAAIDVGAVYRGVFTVLAGGTDPDLRGIAKVINFHHLEWACRERLDHVDFLCGDFGWKELFHLTPRPLYQLRKGRVDIGGPAHSGGVLSYAR